MISLLVCGLAMSAQFSNMEYTQFSIKKLQQSMIQCGMDVEYQWPLINFLLYGMAPGSFFTSVLSNDYHSAILHSHPSNTMTALKPVSQWLQCYLYCCPYIGSHEALGNWYALSDIERRTVLESRGLVYTEEQEVELALKS